MAFFDLGFHGGNIPISVHFNPTVAGRCLEHGLVNSQACNYTSNTPVTLLPTPFSTFC